MKALFINKTKWIKHFANNKTLSAVVTKWVASNTISTLQKNSLNMLLTSDGKQDSFASQLNNKS